MHLQLSSTLTAITSICLIFASKSAPAASMCSIDLLQNNLQAEPQVPLTQENYFIARSTDPNKWLNQEKSVPCSMVDLLELGFDMKSMVSTVGFPAADKNNASYAFQNGSLLVFCHYEYSLSDQEKVKDARAACQQVVPFRLLEREVSGGRK